MEPRLELFDVSPVTLDAMMQDLPGRLSVAAQSSLENAFAELLFRKYQRRRATYEDYNVIEQQVKLRLAQGEKPEEATRPVEEAE